MNIYTLIQYKMGGNRAPCSCCTECEEGDMEISVLTDTDWVAERVARRVRDHHFNELGEYELTVLINGISWDYNYVTTSEYVYDPLSHDSESEQDILFKGLSEELTSLVLSKSKDLISKQLESREKIKQEKDKQEEQARQQKARQAEEAQRQQYLELKKKFDEENN